LAAKQPTSRTSIPCIAAVISSEARNLTVSNPEGLAQAIRSSENHFHISIFIEKVFRCSKNPDERSYKQDERSYEPDERSYEPDERSYEPYERSNHPYER
jgi:hypothetical protein